MLFNIRFFQLLLFVTLSTVFYFFLLLLIIFPWTPGRVIASQIPEKSDLIVILEGEHYIRINHAILLSEKGISKNIFFPGICLPENKKYYKKQIEEHPFINFFSNSKTNSTYEEALRTKSFVKSHSFKKITIVTSPYHSFRSWWIFSKLIPDAEIISTPVPENESWFCLEKAKNDPFHKKVIFREQLKFFFYYLLYSWQIY